MFSKESQIKWIIAVSMVSVFSMANEVSFLSPKDGEKVKNPVIVKMNVSGLKLRPADEDPNELQANTRSHYSLLTAPIVPTVKK